MLKHFTKVTIGALSGAVALYTYDRSQNSVVKASWTTGYSFNDEKWDSNWDQRAPEVSVKPDKLSGSTESLHESSKPKATRNIILIRHGQYNIDGDCDEKRTLTPLGKEQAVLTGSRLKVLGLPYTQIVKSTMTRAQETGSLIEKSLPDIPVVSCGLLEEGAPVPPDPPIGHWRPPKYQFFQDGARIEAAFRKYFHRADLNQEEDSYDILVCHANVIRYFVLRALQYPAEGWLRLSLKHASITWLQILPSGRVILRCYGDSGYMPPRLLTN